MKFGLSGLLEYFGMSGVSHDDPWGYVPDGTGMNSVFKPKVSGAWNLHSGMDAWSANARGETRLQEISTPPQKELT